MNNDEMLQGFPYFQDFSFVGYKHGKLWTYPVKI